MSTIVVAVGNGAGNVIDDFRKIRPDLPDIEYLYLDEDTTQLERHGTGHERKEILERSCETLRNIFAERYDVVILVVCLGGFTGNYYGDAIAEELRGKCEKFLCIASLPFEFEGRIKRINAVAALGNIEQWCDLMAIQDNNCLPGDIDISDINGPMVITLGVLQRLSNNLSGCGSEIIDQIREVWTTSCKGTFPIFAQDRIITFHPKRYNKYE